MIGDNGVVATQQHKKEFERNRAPNQVPSSEVHRALELAKKRNHALHRSAQVLYITGTQQLVTMIDLILQGHLNCPNPWGVLSESTILNLKISAALAKALGAVKLCH